MAEGTRHQTTPAEPVHLLEPTPPPEPTPGCDVCAALARQRTEATATGDYSRASDLTVEMGQHAHESQP
jgi:hypothetical protein